LDAGVAEATEVDGEVVAGELSAAAIEEDKDGGGASGLAVEPGEEGGLGGVVLGLAGEVAGGAGEVVGGEDGGGVGLGAGPDCGDAGEKKLHRIRVHDW
jgi:hypothetical protein